MVFHLCSKNLLILILSHEMLKKNLSRQDKMREKLNVTELRSVSSEISHLLSSTEKFTEMNSLLFSLSNVSDLCLTQFLSHTKRIQSMAVKHFPFCCYWEIQLFNYKKKKKIEDWDNFWKGFLYNQPIIFLWLSWVFKFLSFSKTCSYFPYISFL